MTLTPLDMLIALVQIDTTNPPGNELAALRFIASLLRDAGIDYQVQESATGRGNLLACLPASAATLATKPPLILLSHIDVVSAQPAQWTVPPFAGTIRDGYLYGRGTLDTKHLTVMQIAALLALKESGGMRSRDVYLLTTCDEECGGSLGMQTVLDTIWQLCGRSFTGGEIFSGADVISEGGGFPIMLCGKPVYLCEVGQKGAATVHFTVKARHSKGPFLGSMDGVQRAMALVNELSQLRLPDVSPGVAEQQDATAQPCAFDRFLASLCEAGNVTPDALMSQLSPLMRKMLQAMQSSTLTVTMVEGVSPVETVITCDVRLLPGMQKDVLERIFTDRANAFDADWAWMSYSEGYEGQGSELLDIMEKETGERVVPFLSMGASDGRYLAPLGARVYGYSPVLPSDVTFDQAVSMVHGVDERIHVDSVTFGAQVLTCVVACATNEARQESEEQA